MAAIDFYFSTLSPYAYLAGNRLEKLAERHAAQITYKPFDIMALFPRTGGTPPKDRHPARQEYRLIELERQARKLGMPMNLKPAHWPTNAAPSSYAIIAAQKAGGGDLGALVQGVLRACWAEEKDIAEDVVIRDCLTAAGFDPALADSGLLVGAETYGQNLEDAVSAGVFGAPFYITEDGAKFWGQDRLDDLDRHLSEQ
ncbi:2-hydroxychromene-2-carboxylate isomerase [Phaeobacter sp. QD34_3]|uniref:2-hydroxychromene-2-carboxylate isomerase n=1 Tax=unclassified Phaeobacter TaxID=2621772 RepID=UPI00237F36FB|nr:MULTISPECIES: 2-hydroxychromene-2-carboxylate isomerase [unclassified Phaeobacter]MDE4133996.1 2-hydroxychromene-2-carboxylate isomerase [Phaeobacter sp. QD34_3]MDE4137547.1 2-hydroxychromene-2-carboxylate isomerase [Phaeobacter sp. QD34_24]